MIATVEIGDTVQVELCGTWFTGQVRRLRPNYNWNGETYAEVTGNKPDLFVTTCKVSGLVKIDKEEL